MILAVIRHAESRENADKYRGFYADRRPYSGPAAHEISRNVVGLTPHGFRQCLWLGQKLADLLGPDLRVYSSTYRRAIDTAELVFPDLAEGWPQSTALLDEQHYGDATYMTKDELFATYPEGAEDRRDRKHLWVPPGGGESLAHGVCRRAEKFIDLAYTGMQEGHHIVAITHHTTILALRALLEARPVTDLVEEARTAKTPSAGVLRYELAAGRFAMTAVMAPP
ncbi:MAG: histidine phosphatase family protein [Pseudonocardiaceae bacterium]